MSKNVKLLILMVFLLISTAGLGGAYFFIQQHNHLRQRESQIETLKKDQLTLRDEISTFLKRQKTVVLLNRDLQKKNELFENQKNAILTQVRSSVAGFETYRRQATAEIESLRASVTSLESEKAQIESRLQSVEELSKTEKESLTGQVTGLNAKIDELKSTQAKMAVNLEQKNKSAMVIETGKLHYNLGNFYLRSRDAKKAAAEYQKAIFYNPADVDAHFNLALVSDEFLEDWRTAIVHYKRYLELKPKSADAKKIRERILDLELQERVIDEPVQEERVELFKNSDLNLSKMSMIGDKR